MPPVEKRAQKGYHNYNTPKRALEGEFSLDRREFISGLALTPFGFGKASQDPLAKLVDGCAAPPLIGAGVIARRGDGQIAYAKAAGSSLRGQSLKAFELDSAFRVASVSKLVTSAAFMALVDNGAIDLDQDVSGKLGFSLRHPAFPDQVITARMLLSHTSGLRNGPNYPVPIGQKLADVLLPDRPNFAEGAWWSPPDQVPGVYFAYADVNFAVIAQVIEKVTNQRFDLYMRQGVFAPLAMDAGFNWSGVSQAARDRAATGCRWTDGQWRAEIDSDLAPAPHIRLVANKAQPGLTVADYRLGDNGFVFSPQGGLRSSLWDMDRLARLYSAKGQWNGQQVVSSAGLESISRPVWRFDLDQENGLTDGGVWRAYGLGVEIPTDVSGRNGDQFFGAGSDDWRGHLGDAYGWLTGLFWNIHDGSSLVWAINGAPETGRAPGRRCALSRWEEEAIDIGLAALSV